MFYTAADAPGLSDSWTVYMLAASYAPDVVRYVGITNDLRRRISHHISESRRYSTRKARWVSSVIRRGGNIIARIDMVNMTQEQAKCREMHLIASLRSEGLDLTNLTDGGDGTVGRRHTAEARAKMAASRVGTKAAAGTRAKMSAARKGKPSGRRGAVVPDGVKVKISQSLALANMRPDVRAKRSAGLLKRFQSQEERIKSALVQRRAGPNTRNKTGFKGVSYCSRTQKWFAQIKADDRVRFIGRFPTPEAAARAYDEAARAAWGSDCYLNFG